MQDQYKILQRVKIKNVPNDYLIISKDVAANSRCFHYFSSRLFELD